MTSAFLTKSDRQASMIYVTCGTHEEATAIAHAVVDERLAACANIIAGMRSVYRWQGSVIEDEEVVVIIKTTADKVEKVTERVKTLHSYELPCVVEIPLGGGNDAYFEWIAAETAED